MADFTGIFLGSNVGFVAHATTSPQWVIDGVQLDTVVTSPLGSSFTSATRSFVQFSTTINNNSGKLIGGYAEIYYNRFIIEPESIPLGSIAEEEERDIVVFNAFMENKNVNAITLNNLSGVTLQKVNTGDNPPSPVITPQVFTNLEIITYVATIGVAGPPIINGNIFFDFADVDETDISLSITGTRLTPIPYEFRRTMTEVLEWNTNIITAYDGTEQRIRLRKAPRQTVNIRFRLNDSQAFKVDNVFYNWRARIWAVPSFLDARNITSAVTVGDTSIQVSTLFGDFAINEPAMIFTSPTHFEIFTISAITGSTLTSALPLVNGYATDAQVVPVMPSRLNGDPTRGFSGYDATYSASYIAQTNRELATTASPDQFLGLDVFLKEPLTVDGAGSDQYNQQVDITDFNTGLVNVTQAWENTKIQRRVRYELQGLQEIWEFKLFLYRRAGRWLPFYMPTFEPNLRVTSTGNFSVQFQVKNDDQAIHATLRTHIAIKTFSRGWIFSTVASYVAVDIDTVTVNLTEAISPALTVSDINFISYMGKKRLSSDRIEILRTSNRVAQVTLPMTEVEP